MKKAFEFFEKHEKLYDYIPMEYQPIESFTNKVSSKLGLNFNKKLKISNILFESLKGSAIEDKFLNLVEDLRNKIGLNQTVWGVKNNNQKFAWEIYFYNHQKPNIIKLNNITEILSKHFNVDNFKLDKNLPYRMFSFDIEETGIIDNYHLYFTKDIGNSYHSWSYKISKENIKFENHYEVFLPIDYGQLKDKLLLSPFTDSKADFDSILTLDFLNCKRSICVATKDNANGIYFSGIDINTFLIFLKKLNYPKSIIDLVENNKNKFDYILYDIGFDFFYEDSVLNMSKSGFYGIF